MFSMQMLLAVAGGLLLGLLVALAASRLLSRRTARRLADSEARLRLVQQVGGSAYTDRKLPGSRR